MSWGRLPWGLRERPFDVYAAALLLILGIYVLTHDVFPERNGHGWIIIVVNIIAIYLVAASSVILTALFRNPSKCPAFVLFGEMYGWAFVAAASLATSLLYLAGTLWFTPNSWLLWSIWLFMWTSLFITSGIRSYDLISQYRELKS